MSLSPEREAYYKTKRQEVLKKDQSLRYHYTMQYVNFEAYKAMRLLDIEFACALWPFVPTPDPKRVGKSARKFASDGLIHAAATGHIKDASNWLEMGANVNYQDGDGRTPLLNALDRKRLGMAEFLLQHGANPNMKNKRGWTPVIRSIYFSLPLAFPILKKYGADLDKPLIISEWQKSLIPYKREKYYPLFIACMLELEGKKARPIIKSLLKAGANPEITSTDGEPILKWVNRHKANSRFWLKGTLKQAMKQRS